MEENTPTRTPAPNIIDDPRVRGFLMEVARAFKTLAAGIQTMLESPRK